MASKDTGVQMANGTDDLIWITPHICIKKTVAEKTAAQGQKTSGDKTKDAGAGHNKGVQSGTFGTSQRQAEQTSSAAADAGKGGLEGALAGMLHGPTIKDKTSKENAPIVGPDGIPTEKDRWGSEYVTLKQGAATMQSAAPTQAAATIKSADTTQSAASPGPGLSAALEGMLHGPTIKDKTSKEKAPIVGPGGVPKEEVRWGTEYATDKQGAAKMQSAAPMQAAATIKSADTTQSAAPPGPGLSAALEGMLHGPTIKDKNQKKKNAPVVGPDSIPTEEVRWGEQHSGKQGAAKMQSAAPTQAAATIKSADTTQSAAPPGPGLSAALEGMLHGPTIKDKTSKNKAPIVGPGGVPKEEVRWGTEYATDKQGAAKMQSAAPMQAAATIKSADTTQSAAPPGPGLSAALEGMLHGPTIKDKNQKKKNAPVVGPDSIPTEEVRWGEQHSGKQGAVKMQSAAPMQAAATIRSADTTQSAAPPGAGLSAALEGMLHGPTIKDKTSKEKAPIVGPGGVPKEDVRWPEYDTGKQGAAKMQSAAPMQAAATIKSADTTQSAAPPGPGLSAALDGMLHGPTIKDKNQKKKNAPVVGPDSIPTEEVRWGEQHSGKQGAAKMQSAAPMQAAATIKSADTTQSAAPPGPGLSAALEGMLHGPTIKDRNQKKKNAPVVGPDSIPTEEVRWGEQHSGKQGAAKMQSAAPTQAAATIKSADTTQSAAPPGPGLSAALEGMLHGPTIKDKNQKKKNAPVVGPDSIPTEEVRWGEQHSGKGAKGSGQSNNKSGGRKGSGKKKGKK
ncbi:Hypp4704 [Branchiostoma lanceolatum]|uniref:Hypp4704 protein n=1 Tax=Branchiostoma lanceolatum TaxID=7740 RepID=A0A8K0F2G7_BRALA|nr:Hypp4704 [Branchiostoma lanceolatum]